MKKTKLIKRMVLPLLVISIVAGTLASKQKNSIALKVFCQTQTSTYTVNFNLPSKDIGYLDRYKLHTEKTTAFLKSKTTQSNAYSYNLKVYPRIRLAQYKFSSQQKASDALDSLLTCFPNDCHRLEKWKWASVKFVSSIMIFNQGDAFMAVTNCEHMGDQWNSFKKAFAETYVKPESTVILTSCGRVVWKTGKDLLENIE